MSVMNPGVTWGSKAGWCHGCGPRAWAAWILLAWAAWAAGMARGSDAIVEATRTFVVGQAILDVQDPPRVFAAEVTDSMIVDLTEVRVGLHLVGAPSGGGFASEMYVSITKDLAATAVLLNHAGVTTADGGGFGHDGWDVTFRDDGVLGDVHLLDGGFGVVIGEVQPDGRLAPEATSRPALLSGLNGLVGNGTWRLAVGDAQAGGTMRLESWSLTLVGRTNRAPTFVGLSDRTVPEGAAMEVALAAQDADVPVQALTFALVEGPAGAAVAGARFQWTPPEMAGGTTNLVRVAVSDGVDATTNAFQVVVTEVNQAPSFAALADVTLPDLSPYALALVATDADVPVQALEYELLSGPDGSEVVGNEIRWTPIPEQLPSTNVFVVRVTDGVASVTNQFVVRLVAPNTAPTLGPMADVEVVEGVGLVLNLSGMDADVPANTLAYSLVSGPTGMTVSAAGRLAWTPGEADGPGGYAVTVRVEDDGSPPLDGTQTFLVTVTEVNQDPAFGLVPDVVHAEGTGLAMALTATDPDLPAQPLTYSLVAGPPGLTLSSAGLLEWIPTEAQGPGVHVVRARAADSAGGVGEVDFTITVQEVPSVPVLPALGPFTMPEMAAWTQALGGSDADLPVQALTYSLVSGPTGLVLGSDGVLVWTPTEGQGPGTYSATVRLTDETGLSAERSYTLNVSEANRVPVLGSVASQQVVEGLSMVVQLTATDADVPANALSYALVSGPVGMTVDPQTGRMEWTPSESQGPFNHSVTVSVTDNSGSPLSAQVTFVVAVLEANTAPQLAAVADPSVKELTTLSLTLSGTDVDLPANVLRYRLLAAPDGMTIHPATGQVLWTPGKFQGPSTNVVTAEVYDDGDPSLSAQRTFRVVVLDSNRAPVALGQQLVGTEDTTLAVTLSATDADGDSVSYVVLKTPLMGTLVGVPPNLTYIPSPNAFGFDEVTFRVNDGTVDSGIATISITLNGVNDAPVASDGELSIAEDTSAALVLAASDVDGDALTYTIASGPVRGSVSGTPPNLIYTPAANATGSDQVTFKVGDGLVDSGFATVHITITPINDAPSFVKGADQTVFDNAGPVSVPGWATSIVAGPSDEAGQTLTFLVTTTNPSLFAVAPAISSSGTLSFTPAERASGTCTVSVRLVDSGGGSLGGVDTSLVQAFTISVQVRPRVVGRWLAYGGSAWDTPGSLGDAAIASDKQALRPGWLSSFANVSSYHRGINCIMVDIVGMAGTPNSSDVDARVGTSTANPGAWPLAPSPSGITVRRGAGVSGSDRVTITWPDYSIRNTWLRLRLLPGARTSLAEPDEFYLASVVAEIGDRANEFVVNSADVTRIRLAVASQPVGINSPFDLDRDGWVNSTDVILARLNVTTDLLRIVPILDLRPR